MQKVINVLALTSFAVSAAVVGSVAYVAMNQESIKGQIGDQIGDMIGEAVGGAVGDLPGMLGGGAIGEAGGGLPAPGSSAGMGLPMPF